MYNPFARSSSPTMEEVSTHPLMKQVLAEVAEDRRLREMDEQAQGMEQQRIRAEHGKFLANQFLTLQAEYEVKRKDMHEHLGKMWNASQEYVKLTGVPPPAFLEQMFMSVHIPKMDPNAWTNGFTSTRQAIAAWMQSFGKVW